ncbi:MAG: dienelactone hydrolase family protein [Gammaproteobacteria bacterium]
MKHTLPCVLFCAMLLLGLCTAQAGDSHTWWDEAWWQTGELAAPVTHKVRTSREHYLSEDVEVPVLVARPDDRRSYPAVLFAHGRRGLDDLITLHVTRLAARGFVVYAPDLYSGRFIEAFPIEHDYVLEDDLNRGLDALLARRDISGTQACVYSHTRGGYYALKVAVSKQRQHHGLACYVSYYPHMQDPNAPEPMQVYRYAPEANDLSIPTLIFVGEHEQYQRLRGIEMAISSLREHERPAQLVVYPGVGRGFDFRDPAVRTFADDLASKDAIMRASRFMQETLR